MDNSKVAAEIISSMGSQLDLLFALSVAICGGILALVVQMALRSAEGKAKRIWVEGSGWLLVAFIFQVISLGFGYAHRMSITCRIPQIYRLDFQTLKIWGAQKLDGVPSLELLSFGQFMTFLLGIVCMFIVLCRNWHVVEGGPGKLTLCVRRVKERLAHRKGEDNDQMAS